jgi:hypothetical protein
MPFLNCQVAKVIIKSPNVILCVGKNGSFGFAKRWLVCRAKPNVPFVRLAKIELKKSAVGKNKKYRRVGKECRLTRCPFVIWSVCCSLVKMGYFFC